MQGESKINMGFQMGVARNVSIEATKVQVTDSLQNHVKGLELLSDCSNVSYLVQNLTKFLKFSFFHSMLHA